MSARPCRVCGGPHHAKGLCSTHYYRQHRSGSTDPVPRPVPRQAHEANREYAKARLEDYAELTRELGETREAAAMRLGVCERTIWRYEARLRSGAGNQQREAA